MRPLLGCGLAVIVSCIEPTWHDDSTHPELVKVQLSGDRMTWKTLMIVHVDGSYEQSIVGMFVNPTAAVDQPGSVSYDNFKLSSRNCPDLSPP